MTLQDATVYAERAARKYRSERHLTEQLALAHQTAGLAFTAPSLPPIPAAPERGATWCVLAHWGNPDLDPFVPDDRHIAGKDRAIEVRVNHGRWIIDCPCGGAQLACRTDHRFFCVDCLNAWTSGAWVPVTWPADPDGIARQLASRPVELQNWEPGETVKVLRAENELLEARDESGLAPFEQLLRGGAG